MPQAVFYRYVDALERSQIMREKRIAPGPGQICKYYTPNRFDTAVDAQRYLALHYTPEFRIGPIPADEVPDFDHVQLRTIAPSNGQPGGGREVATTQTLYLFDFFRLT
jgi:hypothetical protein